MGRKLLHKELTYLPKCQKMASPFTQMCKMQIKYAQSLEEAKWSER